MELAEQKQELRKTVRAQARALDPAYQKFGLKRNL